MKMFGFSKTSIACLSLALGIQSASAYAAPESEPMVLEQQIDSTSDSKTIDTHKMSQKIAQSLAMSMVSSQPNAGFVMMGPMADRTGRVIRGWFNWLLGKAEDPMVMLEQTYREMKQDIVKFRQAVARAVANVKRTEFRLSSKQQEVEDWGEKVELALAAGKDDLAKRALVRQKMYIKLANSIEVELEKERESVEKLKIKLAEMEERLFSAGAKLESLQARADAAQARLDAQRALDDLRSDSSFSEFDRFEEEVIRLEAEADANEELVENTLEEQIDDLLEDQEVEAELEEIRRRLESSEEQ